MDYRQIERLRERLLARGLASTTPEPFSKANPMDAAAFYRIMPLAEAMFLVMSADAIISDVECDLLRGALRTLTAGELGTAATAAMVAELEATLKRDGAEVRFDNVAAHLWPDPGDRELALALACATAAADGRIDALEREAIVSLAERLGVSAQRVHQLLSGAGE